MKRGRIWLLVVGLAVLGVILWLVWRPQGKSLPTSPEELVELGHQHGHNGDWQKAHDYFRRALAAGSVEENHFLWATGAALAAGDTNACVEFGRTVLVLFGNDSTPDVAERCAKQVLPIPNAPAELIETAAERADYAAEKLPNSGWKRLAKGMAEYRRGHWAEALKWLERPERSAQTEIAVQALPFGAMARHQLGDSAGARKALEDLNRHLADFVQEGWLCNPRHNTWDNVARAVAVRAEAERLIFGREVSPPLSPKEIIRNRKSP